VTSQNIGLIGLAVMGENLALNIANHGFSVAVYNRTAGRTKAFVEGSAQGHDIVGTYTLAELVGTLEKPRRIILMVKAGQPVDDMLSQLRPLLEPGDLVIDGGNSFFKDTERRSQEMTAAGFRYIGTGISGGEEGALKGPSIMPGGSRDAYELVAPVLTRIAAQVADGPCCTSIGPGGAGHYVKMVHNGIEYGDMQLIAEVYDVVRKGTTLTAEEMSGLFNEWNQGELSSYLIEITAKVLAYRDQETGQPLVDLIMDRAGQKGTGKWTSQNALELGVPIPTIDAAIWSRNMSAYKAERVKASEILAGPTAWPEMRLSRLLEALRRALYAAKVSSYAQGMSLLRVASQEYGYSLNLAEIARIWKGGCIIRASLLDEIQAAFAASPDLPNLLLAPPFVDSLTAAQEDWRLVVQRARQMGIPCPALSASLDYYDSYRRSRLPANLIQAQRDFFGAHTYERVDRPGVFHTEWQE
jgi:6-phosphogluconate dehydrogenase